MAKPGVIVHQMTTISGKPDFKNFDRWFATANRLRTKGTDHLLSAAEATGVSHVVAQRYVGADDHGPGRACRGAQLPRGRGPGHRTATRLIGFAFAESGTRRSQVFGHVASGLGEAQLLVEGPGAGVVGEDVQTDSGQRVVVAPALGGQHDRAAVALAA